MSAARGGANNKSKTPDSNRKKEESKTRPSAAENRKSSKAEILKKGKTTTQASEAKPSNKLSLIIPCYMSLEVKKNLTQAAEESKTPERKQKKGPKSLVEASASKNDDLVMKPSRALSAYICFTS